MRVNRDRTNYHGPHLTFHASRFTFHVSHITFHTSRFPHHVSHITFHTSRFTHHVSRFTLLFPNYFLIKRLDLADDLVAAESIVDIALALRRKPISKRRVRNQPQ